MQSNKHKYTHYLVHNLWLNWAIAFGAISLAIILGRYLPKLWLPFPLFILAYLELVCMRRIQANSLGNSTVMLNVSILTLFWSSLIMLAINFINSKMMFDNVINWSNSNKEIPFITSMVIFPVMIIMSLWVMIGGYGSDKKGLGLHSSNGVIANLFQREARYQVQLMLFIAVGMSAVEIWYYFTYYININLNTPDVFFFTWMPVALYVFSLYFVWNRYDNIASLIGPIAINEHNSGVVVRYIVLSGDRMLLSLNEDDRWDTPAVAHIEKLSSANNDIINRTFENISGCKEFELRYLYETEINNLIPEMKHYAAFVQAENYPDVDNTGSWFSLDQLDRMIKNSLLSVELTDEIYRIFTITMAWKTYDPEGRRLYPIKHYRPTFRLRDLKNWKVDYNDLSWFAVANNNQDRPFYNTRRLWRKITGSKF